MARSEASDREKGLQEQVKAYMGDRDSVNMTGLMRSEGRAREEAEKWKRLYRDRESAGKNGPHASLLTQLAEKSQEIERLKGELQQRDFVSRVVISPYLQEADECHRA